MTIRMPFGLNSGVLTHIEDVPAGLSCGCSCPACGEPLVAKKGRVRLHHFAHATGAECAHGLETALHLGAKAVLERRMEVVLPMVKVHLEGRSSITLAQERRYVIERVDLERRVGNVVPDVLAYISGRPVAIEVRVTHRIDEPKKHRLAAQRLSTVEIDLSRVLRTVTLADLERLVVDAGEHKAWVYNAAAERKRLQLLAQGKYMRAVRRGFALHIDGCPIAARRYRGLPYANVVDDCIGCPHAIEIGPGMMSVTCGGSKPAVVPAT